MSVARACAFVVLLAAWFAVQASAQTTAPPARPVTLVVPIAAGGGMDTLGRHLAERLQERLQQPVVVENRTGGGGVIGADSVVRAAPDGQTLLLMDVSTVLHKWLHRTVPFDVTQDFTPIAMVATTPLMLFALTSFPASDARELIAYSKANPGKLSVGTPGVGSPHHLAMLALNAAAKIDITHVPYRGTAPSLNDLLSGQIPLIWATPVALLPHVESGKVKALGTAALKRNAMFPNVPTVAENAVPGFNVDIWFGVSGPANLQPELTARLAKTLREITAQEDLQRKLSALGYAFDYRVGDGFREVIVKDHERYGAVIRDAGIQPN
jgi:tripartite-type tricarboxylate transporter receptor subunit TctC